MQESDKDCIAHRHLCRSVSRIFYSLLPIAIEFYVICR